EVGDGFVLGRVLLGLVSERLRLEVPLEVGDGLVFVEVLFGLVSEPLRLELPLEVGDGFVLGRVLLVFGRTILLFVDLGFESRG
ncbi:hypothetical protein ACP6PL_03210, partial [Dapis sp. BLCC M126]|uniref:hypothetical protein n=1 Tax=Dapis sp. BLCC M126 TaxID=3400189 RepID=UPI003CE94B45